MTSLLPRYEAKCVQRRCFQWGSVPLRSDIKGTKIPPANILIPLERQLIALQLCHWQFLYNETLQQTCRPLLSKLWKLFSLALTVDTLQGKTCQDSLLSGGVGQFEPRFQGEEVVPGEYFWLLQN